MQINVVIKFNFINKKNFHEKKFFLFANFIYIRIKTWMIHMEDKDQILQFPPIKVLVKLQPFPLDPMLQWLNNDLNE